MVRFLKFNEGHTAYNGDGRVFAEAELHIEVYKQLHVNYCIKYPKEALRFPRTGLSKRGMLFAPEVLVVLDIALLILYTFNAGLIQCNACASHPASILSNNPMSTAVTRNKETNYGKREGTTPIYPKKPLTGEGIAYTLCQLAIVMGIKAQNHCQGRT
jgi:hypothetical protein